MIKNNLGLKNVAVLLIGLMLSLQAYCEPSKKDIQKLNNCLIFDLFINYELSEKNGNLTTIIDFIPNLINLNYKTIRLTSNVGGENQVCNFIFNENGTIENISYGVNNRIYRYDFIYEGNRLTGVNIAGKPRISFGYNNMGQLITITRETNSAAFEYNFEYLDGDEKATITLIVVQGEKRSPSSQKYFVTWQNDFKLESYCFDVYCSNNMKYTTQGDLLSYSFDSVNEDNNIVTWEYSKMDDKQNWIERYYKGDIVFNRTIEYK